MMDDSLGSGGVWVSDTAKIIHFGSQEGEQYGKVKKDTLWLKGDEKMEAEK